MIADWWPDEWDYPVGYHVTVPCEADDAAYRSFHQAFVYDGVDSGGVPVMRYEQDLVRDGDLVDTNFGGNGLCRTTNYAMETVGTNLMRYCTRQLTSANVAPGFNVTADEVDFTVYGQTWSDTGLYGQGVCSTSAYELPWPDHTAIAVNTHESGLYSVGLLANPPPPGQAYYPAELDAGYEPGPWQEILSDQGFGAHCSDYPLAKCDGDAGCPTGYTCEGRYCENSDYVPCSSTSYCQGLKYGACLGICMHGAVTCLQHGDCAGGMMCTGLGECVTPTVSVLNRAAGTDMAFQVNAPSCPAGSRNFSMLGASNWAYVTNDVLRVHGLCSYGDWYNYQNTIKNCPKTDMGTYWAVDPTKCFYIDLASQSANTTRWWTASSDRPDVLFMHTTTCDRDYERVALDGLGVLSGCAPVTATVSQSGVELPLVYDQYAKMHNGTNPTGGPVSVPIAKMPQAKDAEFGFLGLSGIKTQNDAANVFFPCSTLDQCSASPFTINGNAAARRTVRADGTAANHSDNDVFTCGVMGYQSNGQCHVDLGVAQLYKFYCVDAAARSCLSVAQGIDALCNAVQDPYSAGYANVALNVGALNAFYRAIPPPYDKDSYLLTVDCMLELRAYMGAQLYSNFYYTLDFAVYEFPFTWFYQCMVMTESAVDPTSRFSQDCDAYANRGQYGLGTYTPKSTRGDSALTFLKNVQGGYSSAYVDAFLSVHVANASGLLGQAITGIVDAYYGGVDTTYPRCSPNKVWRIGKYGTDEPYSYDEFRALISTMYVTDTCEGTWLQDQLDLLAADGWPITQDNMIQFLTTADLDRLFQDPGWANRATLLEQINATILSGMSVELVDLVIGSSASSGGGLYTRSAAFYLSDALSAAYPGGTGGLDPSTEPAYDPFTISSVGEGNVPDACVYASPVDDPATRDIPGIPGVCQTNVEIPRGQVNDTYTICAGVQCTAVPIWYATGSNYFYCGYYPDLPGSPCLAGSTGCGASLIESLYNLVTGVYAPASNVLLQPEPLAWFGDAWTPSFNLATVLAYLGNIMPNLEQTVMCTVNTQSPLNLMNCTNPNYLALQAHVKSQFKHNGSIVVPGEAQLDWPVDRSFLNRGAIFAFASTDRNVSHTYLDGLFTDSNVCTGPTTGNQRVCVQRNGTLSSVNPWTLGYWNPYTECDVEFAGQTQQPVEFVDVGCNPALCGPSDPYYQNMPFESTCLAIDGHTVVQPGVPQIDVFGNPLVYNLCHQPLQEDPDNCMNDQSLLGGFDGLPVGSNAQSVNMAANTRWAGLDYTVSQDMYTPSTWQIPSDFMGGLFADTNPLLSGGGGPFGFLRIPSTEIGVHRIGLEITKGVNDTFSVMSVYKLPLSTVGAGAELDSTLVPSEPVSTWVPGLLAAIAADSAANVQRDRYYNGFVSAEAACPLRRFAFYSSGRPAFAPSLPSPQRALHVFGNITGRAYAHPTMTQTTDGGGFGKYTTVNGFCFCPTVDGVPQYQCLSQIGADQGNPCSLSATVLALAAQPVPGFGQYLPAQVFQPYDLSGPQPCTAQLDWPNLANPLRDGSPGSPSAAGVCHVLDRLPPFQYAYSASGSFTPSGQSLNGACQTRRVVAAPVTSGRCVRDSISDDEVQLRCAGSASTTPASRLAPLTPAQTVSKAQRQWRSKCARCSAAPRFTTTAGAPMTPPESSFGRPYRLSAERAMAKDLLSAVCAGGCPPLNRSAWARGQFMRNLVLNPDWLFLRANGTAWDGARNASSADDSAKWEKNGWVYCPDRASLVSGQGCLGTMTREEWTGYKTTICPLMVKALSSNGSNDGLAQTPFFDIDKYTMAVSVAYAEAKQLIQQANCIASGNFTCLPKPWAYHPASFEPSNQEWVYETVLSYYRLVSPTACNQTASEKTLAAFNIKFQQNCPANTINLLIDILALVRLVLTDLAYILATVMSMAFRIATLLVTGSANVVANWAGGSSALASTVADAQAQVAKDWIWLKNEAKSMLSGINALLLDMVFTTGEIGKELLIFLNDACNLVNGVYTWFESIWCKYFVNYLLNFLISSRGAMSMVASGFEILQDFMDVTFQGVLPAAFIAKYGNNLFQKAMIEKFSQPSKADKAGTLSKVESDTRLFHLSSDKEIANSVLNDASSLGKYAGIAGTILSFGLGLYDTFNDVEGVLDYPSNFTLFDFSKIFDGIDKLTGFIEHNSDTCADYSYAATLGKTIPAPLTCFADTLANNPALEEAAENSIAATLCWANAQTSLGESNLFACHSGSTCCADNACDSLVMCSQCAAPSFAGESQYACNTLTQQCQCAVPLDTVTPCTSNQQCGAVDQCALASLTSGTSYGTLPCGQCQTHNVYCMVQSTGFPGQCTCYMDNTMPQALCSGASGAVTVVNPTRLCGYTQDTPASSSWQFSISDLAMVSCAQVSKAICSTVYVTASSSVALAVAAALIPGGGGARRRLLWEDDETYQYEGDYETVEAGKVHEMLMLNGWNTSPCKELAAMYQRGEKLGVLEKQEADRCGYWRHAGRRVRELAGLNKTGDMFLVSIDDLAAALVKADVLLELAGNPWVPVYAALFHPWTRPLRAAATSVANLLERADWGRRWRGVMRNASATPEAEDDVEEALEFVAGESERWDEMFRASNLRANRLSNPVSPVELDSPEPPAKPVKPAKTDSPVKPANRVYRRLLSVITDLQSIQAFSGNIADGGNPSQPVPEQVASVWGEGPFAWPPDFTYYSASACPLGALTLQLGAEALTITGLYYANWNRPGPPIDRSIRGALPQVSWNLTLPAAPTANSAGGWPSQVFHGVVTGVFGVDEDGIAAFFDTKQPWTLQWLIADLTKCDLAEVVTCSGHRRDLLASLFVIFAFYLFLRGVCAAVDLDILATLFFMSLPLVILYYVYGYSPMCFPLIPTCALSDLLATAQYLMPGSLALPPEILITQGNRSVGLRPCADLNFSGWADPIAFGLCDLDQGLCQAVAGLPDPGIPGVAEFQAAIWAKSAALANATASEVYAYRICAAVTGVLAVPAVLLLLAAYYGTQYFLLALVDLGPSFAGLFSSVVALGRVPDRVGTDRARHAT